MKPNGIIVYEGKSKFDGKPIVAIITGTARKSQNPKTGNMLQLWIMRSDINPFSSWVTGKDKSVCGTCKHRVFGSCYVNKSQGVAGVFNAYKNNKYPKLDCYNVDWIKGKNVRFGAYGDCGSIPVEVLNTISNFIDGFTGYTHDWKNSEHLKPYCMASCDTVEEQKQAIENGWKTFRIRTENEPVLNNEIKCPASEESGRKTNCQHCQACSGLSSKIDKNVTIIVHGRLKNKFVKIMTLKKRHKKISHLFMKKS